MTEQVFEVGACAMKACAGSGRGFGGVGGVEGSQDGGEKGERYGMDSIRLVDA